MSVDAMTAQAALACGDALERGAGDAASQAVEVDVHGAARWSEAERRACVVLGLGPVCLSPAGRRVCEREHIRAAASTAAAQHGELFEG